MIHVDLNEDAENRLRSNAEAKGIPAEAYAKELLESVLDTPEQNGAAQSARDALADYIGAIDSSTFKADSRYRSGFGDLLYEKYTKQGITLPEWER
jgi:hypothetical protein